MISVRPGCVTAGSVYLPTPASAFSLMQSVSSVTGALGATVRCWPYPHVQSNMLEKFVDYSCQESNVCSTLLFYQHPLQVA